MIRRRIAILFLPAALILALAGAFAWLLQTESGARWAWQRLAGMMPGTLEAGAVSGNLQSGLQLRNVTYRNEAVAAAAASVGLRINLDLAPPALTVEAAELRDVRVRLLESSRDESPPQLTAVLDTLALPLPVEFERIELWRLQWFSAGSNTPVEVASLLLSGRWTDHLSVRRAEAQLEGARLEAHAEVGFREPYTLRLSGRSHIDPNRLPQISIPLDFTVEASGDLGKLQLQSSLEQPAAALQGELRNLAGAPEFDFQLSSNGLVWPIGASEPDLSVNRLLVSLYGGLDDYGAELEAELARDGLPPTQLRLLGNGNADGVDFRVASASNEALDLEGSGRLTLADGPSASGSFRVQRLDLNRWWSDWPAPAPLQGSLDLDWKAGRIEFSNVDLSAPEAATRPSLAGGGHYGLQDGVIGVTIDWRSLAWPPAAEAPGWTSPMGSAQVAGVLQDWSARAEFDLAAAGYPEGHLQVSASGDAEHATVDLQKVTALGGDLSGRAEYRWTGAQPWSVSLQAEHVATAPLAPGFPGVVSADFSASGETRPLKFTVDIAKLTGTLMNRPVQARGGLDYSAERLVARKLQAQFGDSQFEASGNPDTSGGLHVTADVASLGDVLEGASGSLSGEANLSRVAGVPMLRIEARGSDLHWGETTIGSLSITPESAPGGDNTLRLDLENIDLADYTVQSLSATVGGRSPLERIEADVRFADTRAEVQAVGGIRDWSKPLESGWSGELTALGLYNESLGSLRLRESAALAAASGGFSLERACFDESQGGGLCLEGGWKRGGATSLSASLDSVSPKFITDLLQSDLRASQRMTGAVEWRQAPGARAEAEVQLELSAGRISLGPGRGSRLQTGPGVFGFKIADGRLYSGNLDISIPESGDIDTDFSVPDLSAGLNSPAEGRIQVNLDTIQPLLELIPGVEGQSGPVSADMRFSGTLDDPKLTGHASLVRGRLSHFASGLVLDDIRLAGAVYQYDRAEFNGSFKAGEGTGDIKASLAYSDLLEPSLDVGIKGKNLTLIDVPDLHLKADPDIRVAWREGALHIDGEVTVPSARLSPRYLPTTSATESPDLVVVAGEDPRGAAARSSQTGTRILGQLKLELGDDVTLKLERAVARLAGTSTLKWSGNMLPVAEGFFVLDGEISTYGQLLTITEGRINYPNRPIDNPNLNIRAEREIFGNSQIKRAGVRVTGTLKRPELETFTEPMTTKERALALLVTGNDFDYEQGVGGVEVGTYVAPKLYVSYGIGLFDQQNVISVRYDLGKGFGLKATSGQRETGGDISYTIER